MDLSIVVVSWNTWNLLRSCLVSIRDTVGNLSHEVIVVDNASSDGSADVVEREFPEVVLIRNQENRGFARANNQAIAASRGRHVLLLNSDAVLEAGALQTMVDFLDSHPDVAVVGARLLNPDGSFQGSYADFPSIGSELLLATTLSRLVYSRTYPSYPEERSNRECAVDWVFGACLMARRTAIDAVGALDEDYFMYSEETDWCFRMRRAGWQVYYLPSARVVHWSGQSAKTAPTQKRSQLYRSKCAFVRKHHGAVAARSLISLLRGISALKLVFWAAAGVAGAPSKRAHAVQQVRSYRVLLNEL